MSEPLATGECRCGDIQITITAPPLITAACHCRGCQRMTASAYSLSVAIPTPGFARSGLEPVAGALRGEHQHMYCPNCKSWVFSLLAGMDFFVNVRATMLEKIEWTEPFIEMFTSEKLPWVTTPAVHSYETAPTPEEFEPLIGEYQAGRASTTSS